MKKIFLAFAAVAVMASCQKEMGMAPTFEEFENQAVSFSAYAGSAVSRGAVAGADFSAASGDNAGIGVFAFYQPSVNGIEPAPFTTIKYPTPNFMYNQQVKSNAGKWEYSPLKYWPNNAGDQLSFFAYAPYDVNTTWEDLGISTNATGTTLSKTFVIYNDVDDQIDYLFAEPTVNMKKPGSISIPYNSSSDAAYYSSSTASGDVVKFEFKHVLSKVNLWVGVNIDVNTPDDGSASSDASGNATAQKWTDENTTIEIKSIEFKDLAETYTWKKQGNAEAVWTAEGKQNIKVIPSAENGANLITASGDAWSTTAEWHRVLKGSGSGDASSDAYMFIAPQKNDDHDKLADKEIVITYVVKTKGIGDDRLNDSEITNVITKKWGDFKNATIVDNGLKSGNQYNLYFLIGMQTVKVGATVDGWGVGSDHVLDTPAANQQIPLLN